MFEFLPQAAYIPRHEFKEVNVPLKGLEKLSQWSVCGASPFHRSRLLAERVLRYFGIEVEREKERDEGLLWVLDECPFCQQSDGATHVEIKYDGTLCFSCKHNTCRPGGGRYGWTNLRARYEAGHCDEYVPPQGPEEGE